MEQVTGPARIKELFHWLEHTLLKDARVDIRRKGKDLARAPPPLEQLLQLVPPLCMFKNSKAYTASAVQLGLHTVGFVDDEQAGTEEVPRLLTSMMVD